MRLSLRPLLPRETDWEKLTALVIPPVALLGALWLKFRLPLPPCTFKNLTGCPCVGCGATRATHALAGGKLGDALMLNPLATAGFLALAAYWIFSTTTLLTAKGRRLRADGLPKHTGRILRIGVILLVAANWIWVIVHLPESPWRAL